MGRTEIIDRKIQRIKNQMEHARVELEFAEKMKYDMKRHKDQLSKFEAEIKTLESMKKNA